MNAANTRKCQQKTLTLLLIDLEKALPTESICEKKIVEMLFTLAAINTIRYTWFSQAWMCLVMNLLHTQQTIKWLLLCQFGSTQVTVHKCINCFAKWPVLGKMSPCVIASQQKICSCPHLSVANWCTIYTVHVLLDNNECVECDDVLTGDWNI